jgi:hypothetical protein
MEQCKWLHGRGDSCKIVLTNKSTTAEGVNHPRQVKGGGTRKDLVEKNESNVQVVQLDEPERRKL